MSLYRFQSTNLHLKHEKRKFERFKSNSLLILHKILIHYEYIF